MRVRVRYETTLGIYGPIGMRTVKLPRYVQRGKTTVWGYLCWWLKRNVSQIAKPLEWWRE